MVDIMGLHCVPCTTSRVSSDEVKSKKPRVQNG